MLYLRKAEEKDIDLLYEWANDPVVRANSFCSDPISYEDHKKWFSRVITDPAILQFILMADDVPVGQIRLTVDNESAEIGYSIAGTYRGKGYGRRILQLIAEEVHEKHPEIKKLTAKVKPGNMASRKLFESESYSLKYYGYTLNLDR